MRAGNIYASEWADIVRSVPRRGQPFRCTAFLSSSSSRRSQFGGDSISLIRWYSLVPSWAHRDWPVFEYRTCANLEIFVVDDKSVVEPFHGILRKENVRETEVDSVVVADICRPGDIVKALVLSMGDTHSYVCGTARVDLGVIYARDEVSGKMLVPASFDEMVNVDNGRTEKRKVAKPA